ncbi:MAG: CPBP family intramembrane metalloprotease [Bacteroidales bacterium]|nr:CPBP family intramembrane metalloprotease [Bacteroidales bacterium]
MNHLESSFAGKNSFWRYFVMFIAVFLASNIIGGIPLFIAVIIKTISDPQITARLADNPNDLGLLGFDPNVGLIMMLIPFMVGLLAFILLIKPLNQRSLQSVINGTSAVRWSRFFISALVWLIISAIYLIVYYKLDPLNFELNNTTRTLIILSVISVIFIPFQAAFEEVLFRGYLMQGFAVLFRNRWLPLAFTSILFGLMHSLNPEVKDFGFLIMMPQYILFGLIFGIITILDDGIEAAMGAHTANNIFLCIMITNESSALQTPALYEQLKVFPWIEGGALLVSGIIFIVVLKIIFKWKNFSLLFGKIEAPGNVIQVS